mgnify:CR=1 FL=1
MKRMTIVLITVALGLTATAQKKGLQGTWFVTSQFGYLQTSSGNATNTNVTVLPIVGTFVAPTVAVGGAIGYVGIKSVTGATTNANTGLLVVEPLVRKYYGISGGLFFFGQLAAPIISGKEKQSSLSVSQVGLAASGGFDMVLGKHFTVEFSYDLANFTVTTLTPKTGNTTTVTNFSLAHVATADPYYNTALAGSAPNIVTPLSFGFKFLF